MAGLLGAAAMAAGLVVMADPWPGVWLPGVVINGVITAVGAGVLLGLHAHVTASVRHVVLGLGTLGLGLALVYGGGGAPTALFSLMYVWVGVYAGAHMTRRGACAHLGLAGASAMAALLLVNPLAEAVTVAVMALGGAAAAGGVVASLMSRIRVLAGTDPLTGLANRRALEQRLVNLTARRHPRPSVVVALDLDGFKAVNDTGGHAAGDAVLAAAAAAWARQLRPGDLLARVGGDEFVAVLPDCSLVQARDIADRLVLATPRPVTVSVGLACTTGTDDPGQLLAEADEGVYRSKRSGGAGIGTLRLAAAE